MAGMERGCAMAGVWPGLDGRITFRVRAVGPAAGMASGVAPASGCGGSVAARLVARARLAARARGTGLTGFVARAGNARLGESAGCVAVSGT